MLEITQKVDLFEQWETLPQPVQDILTKYSEAESYQDLEAMLLELKPLRYIFDYGLDCAPYNLRHRRKPINKIQYRIYTADRRIKYVGTGLNSWFTLEQAKQKVDYSMGEMIYEFDKNSDPLWEAL